MKWKINFGQGPKQPPTGGEYGIGDDRGTCQAEGIRAATVARSCAAMDGETMVHSAEIDGLNLVFANTMFVMPSPRNGSGSGTLSEGECTYR